MTKKPILCLQRFYYIQFVTVEFRHKMFRISAVHIQATVDGHRVNSLSKEAHGTQQANTSDPQCPQPHEIPVVLQQKKICTYLTKMYKAVLGQN